MITYHKILIGYHLFEYQEGIMKKFLILLIAAVILFSGCVEKGTVKGPVKNGDNISVDYVGRIQNGNIFDTSIESVAKENNLSKQGRDYKPLKFTVGKKQVIQGFDEGVVGMKVGDSKTLTIPPDKAYGPIDTQAIQVYPIIQKVPSTRTFPKILEIPVSQFERIFSSNHTIGENVVLPDSNINFKIQNISSNVSLSYNLTLGSKISSAGAPWNETVIKIDDKNITTKSDVKKNDIIQLQNAPWNTTVVDVDNENVTLKHNAIPDKEISSMFGMTKVHFNETSIIIDQNHELAGKTLVFDITLKSIDNSSLENKK